MKAATKRIDMIQENGKIKVSGTGESVLVQSKLFEMGYAWNIVSASLRFHAEAHYLYWHLEGKRVSRGFTKDGYFNSHPNPLHTIADFTDEIKVGDWVMPDAKVLELLPSEITVETEGQLQVRLTRQYAKFGEVAITAEDMTRLAKAWIENFGENE